MIWVCSVVLSYFGLHSKWVEAIFQVWNILSTELEEASYVLYFLVGSMKYNNPCFTLEGMCNILHTTKPLKI